MIYAKPHNLMLLVAQKTKATNTVKHYILAYINLQNVAEF